MNSKIKKRKMLLGVNIDHVATVRQQRRGKEPDLKLAALEAVRGGADQITMHLREDRRHVQDADMFNIKKAIHVPLNFEMSLSPEIIKIVLKCRPAKACIVPEKRQELTTEGGLDVVKHSQKLKKVIPVLQKRGIQVSLFIDPIAAQIKKAALLGADAIEIHTGRYACVKGAMRARELKRIRQGARLGARLGLLVHAGHGLDLDNVALINQIPEIRELNIGYSIVARSVFVGIQKAVAEMKKKIR